MEPALRFSAEIALIALGFWLIFVHGGTARHLAKLGAPRASVLVLFLVAWLAIQLGDRLHLFYPQERSYYPLVRFAMYEIGWPTETVQSYYVEGEGPPGTTRRLDLATWFPSVEPTALDNRLTLLAHWLEAGSAGDANRARREIGGYVSGLAAALAKAGEPLPRRISLHATRHRVFDRHLVADTVVWSEAPEGSDR